MNPTFDQIFAVMGAASLGDEKVRVAVEDDADTEAVPTKFALALNILLDDLAQHAVEAREKKFAALLEAAPDAMLVIEPSGNVSGVNAHAERLFTLRRELLIGLRLEQLLPKATFETGTRELRAVRREGSELPVEVSFSPLGGGSVIAAVRDISARVEARLQLERANQELESFSYSVAHDLRSPLRAMNGFSRMLVDKYHATLDDEGRDWLERVAKNAAKMGQLIDALLSLARVSRAEIKDEPVDVSRVFRAAAGALGPREGLEIVIGDGITANGDAGLMQVLADNLVGNAWKFTAKKAKARIELGTLEHDGERVLFLRDDGAGFDMKYSNKLFQPFHRLHSSEFPGTGIGLATVAAVVRRHGGRIWAEGRVDGGATFWFTLKRKL